MWRRARLRVESKSKIILWARVFMWGRVSDEAALRICTGALFSFTAVPWRRSFCSSLPAVPQLTVDGALPASFQAPAPLRPVPTSPAMQAQLVDCPTKRQLRAA